MDATSLRALNHRCWPMLLRPRSVFSSSAAPPRTHTIPAVRFSSSPSPLPSSSVERGDANVQSNGNAGAVRKGSRDKHLQVVLFSPQIAGNTGSVARTCAALAVGLHLVEVHSSWSEFRDYFMQQEGEKRLLAFTKRGTSIHSDFSYKPGDWLVFGSETSGLSPEALDDCSTDGIGGGTIKIPMIETYVRCLNLSVSVGIALYEASRQLNYEQLQFPPDTGSESERLFVSEDIFG